MMWVHTQHLIIFMCDRNQVSFQSKDNKQGRSTEEVPPELRGKVLEILKKEWLYIMPLVIITIFMLSGYSPGFSAILGLATCIAVSFKEENTRIDIAFAVIMLVVLLGSFVNMTSDDTIISANKLVILGIIAYAISLFFRKNRRERVGFELKQFVRFPFDLYRGSPLWVPPLIGEELDTLRWDRNPAFEVSRAKYWLALDGSRIVGRIAGIINNLHIEKWDQP